MGEKKGFFHQGQDYETMPVPKEGRVSGADVTMVLGGYMASVTTFMLGLSVGMRMELKPFLIMLLISYILLSGTDVLSSIISYRTGLTWSLMSRHLFGKKAGLIPALLVALLYTGWIGFNFSWVPAYTVDAWGWPFMISTIGFSLLFSSSAYVGFNAIKWLSRVAVPLFLLWAAWLMIASVQHVGMDHIVNYVPTEPMSFSAALAAIIGQWVLTSVAGTCDINRFAVDIKAAIWSSIWSHVFRILLIVSGFFTAVAFNTANPGTAMLNFGPIGTVVGFILIFLLMWTTVDNGIYAATIAISGALTWFNKRQWTLILVPLSLIAALMGIMKHFLPWLSLISVVVPPLPGLLITEFFVLPLFGYRKDIWDVNRDNKPVVLAPLLAFIISSIVSYYIRNIAFSEFMIIGLAGVIDVILVMILEPKPARIAVPETK